MDTDVRTPPRPAAVRPVRENGASALDHDGRRWPAPDPSARVLDRWGMAIVAPAEDVAWPAPDPVMRFDLPAPDLGRRLTPDDRRVPRAELVDPVTPVSMPDLGSVTSAALAPPPTMQRASAWPAPTLDTAAGAATTYAAASTEQPQAARGRFSTRAIVAAVAAAGTVAAGAVAAVALF